MGVWDGTFAGLYVLRRQQVHPSSPVAWGGLRRSLELMPQSFSLLDGDGETHHQMEAESDRDGEVVAVAGEDQNSGKTHWD